jgi:uncharacterized protein (DUF58 family)
MKRCFVKPGPVLFIAVLVWLFLGAAAFFSDTVMYVWLLAGAGCLPIAILDFFALLLLTDPLKAERSVASSLALGVKSPVTITIRRTSRSGSIPARSTWLFDIYPESMDVAVFPAKIKGPVKSGAVFFEYTVLPVERGSWEFSEVQILLGSFLGCWRLKVIHPCVSRGRTFPDFKKLAAAGDLRILLEKTGSRDVRKRGQGMEFMSLREYRKGDSVKAIDWRATGRRRKVIVREYQEEQDQQILFLLDSGYRLHRQEEPPRRQGGVRPSMIRTQFDSALEAAMVLSWVALKHGDSVAAGCFGAEERWLPPRKGLASLPGLMRSLYDVRSASAPSSLFSALEGALARLKRRSFIIMISNFREEDGESLSWIIRHVRRRHLLLLVSLREPEAEFLAKRIPAGREEELESAAARTYLAARKKLYTIWNHSGILILECNSGELSPALISRYLEVKRGGFL